ncbi:MAG: DEAD/DEAH box helicase [Candidatus Wallbacteria bacterium]|nr:DEAD/DEAH box helicase [Candidatus Wallbacteria bacterium]
MNYPLYPFQSSFINRFVEEKSIILSHPMGTGKTRTAIECFLRLKRDNKVDRALVLTTASLIANFIDNIKLFCPQISYKIINRSSSHELGPDFNLISFSYFVKHFSKFDFSSSNFLIIDEFHHSKNEDTKTSEMLKKIRTGFEYFLPLTGTPFQNNVKEFINLVEIVSNKNLFPLIEREFQRKWDYRDSNFLKRFYYVVVKKKPLYGQIIGIKKPGRFRDLVSRYYDFVDLEKLPSYPKLTEENCEITLDQFTQKKYDVSLSRLKKHLNYLDDEEDNERKLIRSINKLQYCRQTILNPLYSDNKYYLSPKVAQLIADLKKVILDDDNRCLIYSNFVNAGVNTISYFLTKESIEHEVFIGDTSKEKRANVLKDFKSGKNRVVVFSNVGGEGLDLPQANKIFIIDPHFNPSIESQMLSRARRINSNWKEICVKRYLAKCINNSDTIDQKIFRISEKKKSINNLISDTIRGKSC